MSAYVVVQLVRTAGARRSRASATTLHHGAHPVLAHDDVKRLLNEHGAKVVSSPESSPDETTACATIAVADMACADRLAAALRGVDGIETAYAKPGEELP